MSDPDATWVYAVAPGAGPDGIDGLEQLRGVGGEPVRNVNQAGLTAIVSSIAAADVEEEALARGLGDAKRLEAMVRAHHRVVEVIARQRPTVPLRLATIYRDDDRVRGLLTERHGEFTEMLQWLDGRTECGVKVWAEDRRPQGSPPAAQEPPPSGEGAGTAYLLRRRASRQAREEEWQRAVSRADEIHAALSELALAAHRHPPQDSRLAGGPGLMVLNGAYLVDSVRRDDFAARAEAIASRAPGYRAEVTGPWPPYSFTGSGTG